MVTKCLSTKNQVNTEENHFTKMMLIPLRNVLLQASSVKTDDTRVRPSVFEFLKLINSNDKKTLIKFSKYIKVIFSVFK